MRTIPLKQLLILLAMCLATAWPVLANTINVPADQPTIQAGIDAASEGDTVLVAPGTYSGAGNRDLVIGVVNLVLLGEAGAENTTIDCEGASKGMEISGELTDATIVQGLDIIHAFGGNGGGIRISHASPAIKDCILRNNVASMNGGGIYCGYGADVSTISGCVFYGNESTYRSGGVMIDHTEVLISDCVFYDNMAGTMGGGAIFVNSATLTVSNCTIVANGATSGTVGIHATDSSTTVYNTLLAYNGAGTVLYGVGDAMHCLTFGNEGGDDLGYGDQNIIMDPLFCDWPNHDYTLHSNSPCAAYSATNPWSELIGALDVGCADSATSLRNWGDVKALFR